MDFFGLRNKDRIKTKKHTSRRKRKIYHDPASIKGAGFLRFRVLVFWRARGMYRIEIYREILNIAQYYIDILRNMCYIIITERENK